MGAVILDHYEEIVEDNMHFMEQAKLKRNQNLLLRISIIKLSRNKDVGCMRPYI